MLTRRQCLFLCKIPYFLFLAGSAVGSNPERRLGYSLERVYAWEGILASSSFWNLARWYDLLAPLLLSLELMTATWGVWENSVTEVSLEHTCWVEGGTAPYVKKPNVSAITLMLITRKMYWITVKTFALDVLHPQPNQQSLPMGTVRLLSPPICEYPHMVRQTAFRWRIILRTSCWCCTRCCCQRTIFLYKFYYLLKTSLISSINHIHHKFSTVHPNK